MAQPPAYVRSAEFAEDERNNVGGRSTVKTADVDAELDAVATSVNAIRVNLSLNQRDDGEIRDARVKLFTLAPDVLNFLISQGEVTIRGAWLTATSYALKDVITQGGSTYICAVAHTSGTFATDLSAVKWILIAGPTSAASVIPFTPTATLAANNVQSAIDESDTENRALSAAAQTAGIAAASTLETKLADATDALKGSGKVGFLSSLSYGAATVGKFLRDLTLTGGADLVGWISSASGAVARSVKHKISDHVSVMDFMSVSQRADVISGSAPTLDSQAAFDAAWDYIKTRGGKLIVPPGNYLWNAQVTFDFTSPVTIKVEAYGARIFTGASVTGAALMCSASFNEFPSEICGFVFDARGNANVGGAIDLVGCHNVHVHHCSMEFHTTKAGCYFIHLYGLYSFGGTPPSGTADDWNSFWCKVTDCTTRKRSGGEPGTLTYGIKTTGAANALTVRDNTISNVDYGVYAIGEPTTVGKALPNGVRVESNFFETITTASIHIQMAAGQLGPTGWQVPFNRTEATTTFFSMATGGAAASIHSAPPFLLGNYCTTGSVSNWILNPTSYPISVFESRYPGFGPSVDNQLWQSGSMIFRFDSGKQFYLMDSSGSTDYSRGRLVFGNFNIWTNTGTGKLMINGSVPANAADGTVVGTQT